RRRRAALLACRESADRETERRGSRFSARETARPRRRDGDLGFRFFCPTSYARLAERRVLLDVRPFFGGLSGTPARRALDNPMAIACLAERAPCLPSRTCSISSRTNSPAWVDGDFPSRASSRARSIVSCSGIAKWFRW